MQEFFNGWRRKAGCGLLVMACALMGLWIRSCIVIDNVRIPFGNQRLEFATFRGGLYLELLPAPTFRNSGVPYPGFRNQFRWLVRPIDPTIKSETWNLRGPSWCIPFRQLAVALAILSAYLLLWKPRTKVERDA
jgi:hypothetical protein